MDQRRHVVLPSMLLTKSQSQYFSYSQNSFKFTSNIYTYNGLVITLHLHVVKLLPERCQLSVL